MFDGLHPIIIKWLIVYNNFRYTERLRMCDLENLAWQW